MKYLLLLTLLVSCAHKHHGHEHDKHEHHSDKKINWSKESKKLSDDYKKAQALLEWFERYLREHNESIDSHIKMTKSEEKEILSLKKKGKNLQAKKLKLATSRRNEELSSHHSHFRHEHHEFMEIIGELEELKSEISNHDHD